MTKIFLPIFFFIFPCSLSASTDLWLSQSQPFHSLIREIVAVGKSLEKNPQWVVLLSLDQKRQSLLQLAHTLFLNFETKSLKKPTFDISSVYKLSLQRYKLSCEIAAMKMLIDSLSPTRTSEELIFASLPRFAWPLSRDRIWWDPDEEFVWSYNWSQRLHTGYGIYEKPLSKYLDSIGISNTFSNRMMEIFTSPRTRITQVLESLHLGSRVILWWDWCTESAYEDGIVEKIDNYVLRFIPISWVNECARPSGERIFSWRTSLGKEVIWLSGEHAFLLLGYMGSIERPTHIIVWDTDTGRHIYPYTEWMRKWRTMDYRSLIASTKDIVGI